MPETPDLRSTIIIGRVTRQELNSKAGLNRLLEKIDKEEAISSLHKFLEGMGVDPAEVDGDGSLMFTVLEMPLVDVAEEFKLDVDMVFEECPPGKVFTILSADESVSISPEKVMKYLKLGGTNSHLAARLNGPKAGDLVPYKPEMVVHLTTFAQIEPAELEEGAPSISPAGITLVDPVSLAEQDQAV